MATGGTRVAGNRRRRRRRRECGGVGVRGGAMLRRVAKAARHGKGGV